MTRRLKSYNYHHTLKIAEGKHELDITVAYDKYGHVHEIAFSSRGTIGQGMDQMLVDLGIAVSRAIQDRDPITGDDISSEGEKQ